MRVLVRFTVILLIAVFAVAVQAHTNEFKVLVFSKTEGYRHSSIPNGISMIQSLGTDHHFAVDTTEDAALFTDENLTQYQAVVFLMTTGDVLDSTQEEAFERYIQAGGGYVGIHAASDTEYDWPWYSDLVGAYFAGHPEVQEATVQVADRTHPSTVHLPARWNRMDEWYDFGSNPRGKVHVLATLDETTYADGAMGKDHPIAWCHDYDGGRAWYTGGGHTEESYSEPLFQAHVLGGIEWAASIKKADAGATISSNFQLKTLDRALDEPMELSIAPDGRVFYIGRPGWIRVYKPQTSSVIIAGEMEVFSGFEDGLLGIALDPGFPTNNWLYLMYSPPDFPARQHVSRFTVIGDFLDMSSEKIVLVIPTQRDECCHSAGSLTFGPDGNLYISTGDNTNPYESENYAPIDQRPERMYWDAQKTSANANDLRGKVLRIRPQTNGTYTIPAGNLFPIDTPLTRPEIYIMGCRNPFRISIDPQTGWLYWGDVGPDAYDDSDRGPRGYDEINQARSAGNHGWPYFVADNQAYSQFDFNTGTTGSFFNFNAITNISPNNSGIQVLPPARPAFIWYPYAASPEFPELAAGAQRIAIAGPVYNYDPASDSTRKFPIYYDKTLFIHDAARFWTKEVKLDDDGNILKINPFLPHLTLSLLEMEMGPDGALYGLDWLSNRLCRIEYVGGNYSPIAIATATPDAGSVPLAVQFSSLGSTAIGTNQALEFAWSFLGNGTINSTSANPVHVYSQPGNYTAQLTVTDAKGNQTVANVHVVVGNNRPVVSIEEPAHGAIFDWGQPLKYRVRVEDLEDGTTTLGTLPCSEVTIDCLLGHDSHSHSQGLTSGCDGSLSAPILDHPEEANFYAVLRASYTDSGISNAMFLEGNATHILHPRRKEAEHFTDISRTTVQMTTDLAGSHAELAGITNGAWISLSPLSLTNITGITFRVAGLAGGYIDIRAGQTNGPIVATAEIPPSSTYGNISCAVTNAGTTTNYYFVFRHTSSVPLMTLNWVEFQGAGANAPIFVQASPQVTGNYEDVFAEVNYGTQTIQLPVAESSRFYRLRSTETLKIKNFHINGTNVVMGYGP